MYFLGLALDHDFDGVSYDQLSKNEALKTKLVKFAIDKGAIKLGDYSSLTGGTYDPNHDGIGVGISLEPAFDNSINDTNVAAALASASAGSSFYKKLDVYSGIPDTPTPVTSVAEIDKLELPAKGYTGDHITIIGKTPHTATNDAEYQHIFYDTIFESVLSMVKKLDTLANVAANSKFSVLMFGYGLTYYKYAYKYNNIPLHEINRTYKAVFTAAAGAKILPPHE